METFPFSPKDVNLIKAMFESYVFKARQQVSEQAAARSVIDFLRAPEGVII